MGVHDRWCSSYQCNSSRWWNLRSRRCTFFRYMSIYPSLANVTCSSPETSGISRQATLTPYKHSERRILPLPSTAPNSYSFSTMATSTRIQPSCLRTGLLTFPRVYWQRTLVNRRQLSIISQVASYTSSQVCAAVDCSTHES